LLATLAFTSILCVFLGFLLLPAVAGAILAGLGGRMAAFDLRKMDRGQLDPGGKEETEKARHQFGVGLLLNLLALFCWALVGYIFLLLPFSLR
jgi:hypothetical protein